MSTIELSTEAFAALDDVVKSRRYMIGEMIERADDLTEYEAAVDCAQLYLRIAKATAAGELTHDDAVAIRQTMVDVLGDLADTLRGEVVHREQYLDEEDSWGDGGKTVDEIAESYRDEIASYLARIAGVEAFLSETARLTGEAAREQVTA